MLIGPSVKDAGLGCAVDILSRVREGRVLRYQDQAPNSCKPRLSQRFSPSCITSSEEATGSLKSDF